MVKAAAIEAAVEAAAAAAAEASARRCFAQDAVFACQVAIW